LDFLPRGNGVVTRRPLELRLVHTAHCILFCDYLSKAFKQVKMPMEYLKRIKENLR
jgi:hypothetical protein